MDMGNSDSMGNIEDDTKSVTPTAEETGKSVNAKETSSSSKDDEDYYTSSEEYREASSEFYKSRDETEINKYKDGDENDSE